MGGPARHIFCSAPPTPKHGIPMLQLPPGSLRHGTALASGRGADVGLGPGRVGRPAQLGVAFVASLSAFCLLCCSSWKQAGAV